MPYEEDDLEKEDLVQGAVADEESEEDDLGIDDEMDKHGFHKVDDELGGEPE